MPLPPEQLAKKAREVRREVIEMIYHAGSGHPGGSLSSTDILTALFFSGCLRFNSHNPTDPRRDRFLLSCGHVCPAYYAVLSSCGFFAKEELGNLRALDSPLQGHPSRMHAPFVECSTGSLGQGLGVAAGMALAAFLKNENYFVFALTSDGEHDEGSLWEAVMFAAHHQLGNLINIVDRNGMQIGGKTEKQLALEPLAKKYESFGWQALVVNGHDYRELIQAICQAKENHRQPTAIIAQTVRGKGVSFMEGKKRYHACTLALKEYEEAMKELAEESKS